MSELNKLSIAERLKAAQASYRPAGKVLLTPRRAFPTSELRDKPAPQQGPSLFKAAAPGKVLAPSPSFRSSLGGMHTLPPARSQPDLFKPAPTPKKVSKPKTAKPQVDVQTKTLKALALSSLSQMLLCVPSAYSDCRAPLTCLAGLSDGFRGLFWLKRTGEVEALDGSRQVVSTHPYATIFEAPYQGYWSKTAQLRIQLVDEAGATVWLAVFNPWRMKEANPHGFMLVEGEIQQFGSRRFLTGSNEPPSEVAGQVWVRYVCPGAPSEAAVRMLVGNALLDDQSLDDAAHSLITTSLLSEAQLIAVAAHACGRHYASLREFFMALHQPDAPEDGTLAAVAARAMAVAGICNAAKAGNFRAPSAKAPINLTEQGIEALIASQAETLTNDQALAIRGVVSALRAPHPLNGLISGDVGTGKTLVFLIPAVAAQMAGARVAIISPTEILANQVAANVARRFPDIPVERVLAGGKIKNPNAILVGTSGMGSVARKMDYTPNFLIIDEQHKLATKDRNAMLGPWTHQLEASATPIPRSLAATLFSGMQVFNLTQAPVVRDIESFLLDESLRGQAVAWMRTALEAEHRVAVIYPRVEKVVAKVADTEAAPTDNVNEPHEHRSAGTGVNSVNAAAEALALRFPGRVGKIHGKMTADEISQTLLNFRTGVQPLVVASTIMETGIDIPDIRLLIVKDADNFGAAQLHQLRGRLARNGGHARFVMMVADKAALPPETAGRLNTVRTVCDGYALAEADMASRGFGDLAGNTQSGNISCAFRLLRLSLDDFVHCGH